MRFVSQPSLNWLLEHGSGHLRLPDIMAFNAVINACKKAGVLSEILTSVVTVGDANRRKYMNKISALNPNPLASHCDLPGRQMVRGDPPGISDEGQSPSCPNPKKPQPNPVPQSSRALVVCCFLSASGA